jgi:hypothetical protein
MQHKFYTLYSIDFADFVTSGFSGPLFGPPSPSCKMLTVLTSLFRGFFSPPSPPPVHGLKLKNVLPPPKTLEYG